MEDMLLSQRILQLRKERGLSQKELGDAVGLSHKAISTIESGTRSTTIEKLVALARFFGVSTDYLLGLRDTRA
ncbi:hypothetical protein CE91St41_40380 [Oscillospiraceae bacterium]|nr:hypothetical protein CE91St40_40350 [Oscillospiraceae bacterium]BDF77149.1 hypothetical protein CE91St41_40380 [Oscillospiraceae bacterium]